MNTQNKPILTVFTPTYNRIHTLPRVYESLLKQSNKDFIWLIVDDGSSDNTDELVKEWQKNDNGFEIQYVYKKNGGMHSAHNTAYDNIKTELNTCIDSDDAIGEEAVEKIISFWKEHGSDKYAGIIGLDADMDNKVIGKGFPEGLKVTTTTDYYANGGSGDKKMVYRTDVINKYPRYPEFEGEKFVPLGLLYVMCDQDYELLVLDEILVNVEYQEDGSTKNMYSQYKRNPKGFRHARLYAMKHPQSLKRLFVVCMHYVSCSLFIKDWKFLKNSPKKLMTFLAIPFGIALNLFIRYKTK